MKKNWQENELQARNHRESDMEGISFSRIFSVAYLHFCIARHRQNGHQLIIILLYQQ